MTHPLSRTQCRPKAKQRFTVDGHEHVLGGSIGDGAAGVVRKATRVNDDMPLAVKFLAPDPKYIDEAVFDDVANRFRREGERGAKLDHPHLISIYSYCENVDGDSFATREPTNPFLLMEHIRGRTLESYILKQPSDEQGVFAITRPRLHIAIQLATALENLHKSKLIHRDVKPSNIFLSRSPKGGEYPFVKLGDFGVMKWGDFHPSLATGTLTATSQRGLGTFKYMSPEQAIAPKEVTVRADVYSLGITLFELFSAQILASPHHVYEIMHTRLTRGATTIGRFLSMRYTLDWNDEGLAELLLDMHLRGASGRPAIQKIRGSLEYEYERRYDTDWRSDLY